VEGGLKEKNKNKRSKMKIFIRNKMSDWIWSCERQNWKLAAGSRLRRARAVESNIKSARLTLGLEIKTIF